MQNSEDSLCDGHPRTWNSAPMHPPQDSVSQGHESWRAVVPAETGRGLDSAQSCATVAEEWWSGGQRFGAQISDRDLGPR